ncbi:MAG: hypothetical protein ACFFER_00900 [Candidatus Thorarchaeota archaeon]
MHLNEILDNLARLAERYEDVEIDVPPPEMHSFLFDPKTDENYPPYDDWNDKIDVIREDWENITDPLAVYHSYHGAKGNPISQFSWDGPGVYLFTRRICETLAELIRRFIKHTNRKSDDVFDLATIITYRFLDYICAHEAGHRYSEAIWTGALGDCQYVRPKSHHDEERFAQLYSFVQMANSYEILFESAGTTEIYKSLIAMPQGQKPELYKPDQRQMIKDHSALRRVKKPKSKLVRKLNLPHWSFTIDEFLTMARLGNLKYIFGDSLLSSTHVISAGFADLVIIHEFIRNQPAGYRDWYKCSTPFVESLGVQGSRISLGLESIQKKLGSIIQILTETIEIETKRWANYGNTKGWSPFILCNRTHLPFVSSEVSGIADAINQYIERVAIDCNQDRVSIPPLSELPYSWI